MQEQKPVEQSHSKRKVLQKEERVDVSNITFDYSIPQEHRMAAIWKAVKNPYNFHMKEMNVTLEFAENAPPLQDVLSEFLIRNKDSM